jgi:hypothetical protein
MPDYILQTRRHGDDWKDETTTLFKNRHRCKHGKPTAQPAFEARKSEGLYARLISWKDGDKTILDETP